jgi:hypothetical protein
MAASVMQEQVRAQADLPLPSFGVRGFRAFSDLQMPALARVNLFVGRNNVGKTSLLEAINLYAGGGTPGRIRELLGAREEIPRTGPGGRADPELLDAAVGRLFHAGGEATETRLTLGPLNHAERELSIRRGWAVAVRDAGEMRFSLLRLENLLGDQERAVEVRVGTPARVIPDARLFRRVTFGEALQFLYPVLSIPAHGLSTEEVGYAWDRIALTDEEDLVTDTLRIIAPDVERISLVGDVDGPNDRRMMVRIRGQNGPVPLRGMGDGMNRLLGISLSLAAVSGGILLVDEIENGIHYSVQPEVWRSILRAAESLNVQVFATTHSWDCIRAFALATSESPGASGMLHRLEQAADGEIRSIDIGEEDLAIIARQRIEVR